MQKVREILRNEYIGAITIGLVLAQAAGIAISIAMRPISFYLEKSNRPRSIFGATDTTFPWGSLVAPTINLVLSLLVAFGLLYWLYLKQAHVEAPAAPVRGPETPADGSAPP